MYTFVEFKKRKNIVPLEGRNGRVGGWEWSILSYRQAGKGRAWDI